ncbi:MAG: TRAP transporter permease [Alphaproteobacteria bacterium]
MREGNHKVIRIIIALWLLAGVTFHLWTAAFGVMEAWLQRLIHLTWVLPIAFLLWPVCKSLKNQKIPIYDWVLAGLAILPGLYGVLNFEELLYRIAQVDEVTQTQLVLGLLLIILLFEATRRLLGLPLFIISLFFLGYMLLGSYFPSSLKGEYFSLTETVELLYLTTDGIMGVPLGVSATYVVIFLIFGSFLEVSSIGAWFMDFSTRLAGKYVGGSAKVAVVSSCLFGSISGSAVANVYSTGNFTIPMMKRSGFSPVLSGGIETMASTGGQLMPPLMGAGAFVMASFLGVEFRTIILAALLPALLYYGTALLMIHFTAKKQGFMGLKENELPLWKDVLNKSFLLLPIIVLVIALMMGKTPMRAGLYAIALVWLISLLNPTGRMGVNKLLDAFILGAKSVPVIAVACASAGIVIGAIALTGIGFKIGALIGFISGDSVFIALFCVAFISVIFGMGLPTTSAYIITAALGVPILTELGIEALNAHLFIFYFAVLSNMTPPVALASFAAASISGAKATNIALAAMKMGVIAFILPFSFAVDSSLLLQSSLMATLISLSFAVIAAFSLSIGFSGFWNQNISQILKICLILSGSLCLLPIMSLRIIGALFCIVLLIYIRKMPMKASAQTV